MNYLPQPASEMTPLARVTGRRRDVEWNDEQIRTLKRLWSEGYSAGEIAMVLGCSRSAVIGKVHRLGLATRGKATRSMRPRMKVKKSKPAPKPQSKTTTKPKPEPKPATKLSGLRPRQPTPLPVVMEQKTNPPLKGILDLGPRDCRWSPPEMHPRDPGFGFCGKPTVSGEAWCADHYYRVYNKPRKSPETEGMEEAA